MSVLTGWSFTQDNTSIPPNPPATTIKDAHPNPPQGAAIPIPELPGEGKPLYPSKISLVIDVDNRPEVPSNSNNSQGNGPEKKKKEAATADGEKQPAQTSGKSKTPQKGEAIRKVDLVLDDSRKIGDSQAQAPLAFKIIKDEKNGSPRKDQASTKRESGNGKEKGQNTKEVVPLIVKADMGNGKDRAIPLIVKADTGKSKDKLKNGLIPLAVNKEIGYSKDKLNDKPTMPIIIKDKSSNIKEKANGKTTFPLIKQELRHDKPKGNGKATIPIIEGFNGKSSSDRNNPLKQSGNLGKLPKAAMPKNVYEYPAKYQNQPYEKDKNTTGPTGGKDAYAVLPSSSKEGMRGRQARPPSADRHQKDDSAHRNHARARTPREDVNRESLMSSALPHDERDEPTSPLTCRHPRQHHRRPRRDMSGNIPRGRRAAVDGMYDYGEKYGGESPLRYESRRPPRRRRRVQNDDGGCCVLM